MNRLVRRATRSIRNNATFESVSTAVAVTSFSVIVPVSLPTYFAGASVAVAIAANPTARRVTHTVCRKTLAVVRYIGRKYDSREQGRVTKKDVSSKKAKKMVEETIKQEQIEAEIRKHRACINADNNISEEIRMVSDTHKKVLSQKMKYTASAEQYDSFVVRDFDRRLADLENQLFELEHKKSLIMRITPQTSSALAIGMINQVSSPDVATLTSS